MSVNETLVEGKMCTFILEPAHFIFNKCPIYTHDGAIAKFSTSWNEKLIQVIAVFLGAIPLLIPDTPLLSSRKTSLLPPPRWYRARDSLMRLLFAWKSGVIFLHVPWWFPKFLAMLFLGYLNINYFCFHEITILERKFKLKPLKILALAINPGSTLLCNAGKSC